MRIDTLALAIANLNEAFSNPESQAFRTNNPGLMKAKTLEHLGSANDQCVRLFSCVQGGYKSLTDSLKKRCQHYPNSTLQETLAAHGHGNEFSVATALDFIQRATGDRSISSATNLKFFTEK
jgi:hypothetical protein